MLYLLFIMANLLDLKFGRISCKYVNLLFSDSYYSLNVPEILTSGYEYKLSNGLSFLPKVSLYGLWFPKFGVLNVMCKCSNGKYFGHI